MNVGRKNVGYLFFIACKKKENHHDENNTGIHFDFFIKIEKPYLRLRGNGIFLSDKNKLRKHQPAL
jgi:hypothetical protein